MNKANLTVLCPACNQDFESAAICIPDFEYRIFDGGHYVQCSHCHTIHQFPMPDYSTLSSYYPPTYHSQTSEGFIIKLRHSMRLKHLKPYIESNGIVLDYGCGNGSFINFISKTIPSIQCFGYEISDFPQVQKNEETNITMIKGDFKFLLDNLPQCSLITMNHVIEHLPDPSDTLKSLYVKLTAGGYLEGQTPVANSLEQKIFKQYWSGYHAPRHTVVFSQNGLSTLLKKLNFTNIKITTAFNPACLAISLASLCLKERPKGIPRDSKSWLLWLILACIISPIDLLSRQSGAMNFIAHKESSRP